MTATRGTSAAADSKAQSHSRQPDMAWAETEAGEKENANHND
jgi:hypothetical protein